MKNIFAVDPVPPKANNNTTANKNAGGPGGTLGGNVGSSVIEIPGITNPFNKIDTLPGIAGRVITVMFALIVIAAVVVIIIAGFRMIVGGSNPEQLKKSKSAIIWAIVGLVVAFMSYAIVSIVQKLL